MNFKKSIAMIIVLSIALKVVFLFVSKAYLNLQAFEYEDIAVNMLGGHGYCLEHFGANYYAYLPPGFPVLCFLIYKLLGHHQLLVVFAQVISSSLLVIPVAVISRRLFDETTAVLAGFLTAAYPPFIIYSTAKLHTLSFDTLIFALCLLSFIAIRKDIRMKQVILTGIISGLAVLFRTTSTIFIIFSILWFYFTARYEIKKKLLIIFTVTGIAVVMISPWLIRSQIIFKNPFLFTTNKFECFWLGNIPGSSGSLFAERGMALFEKHKSELSPDFFKMDELKQGLCLMELTKGYLKSDPKAFIGRILKKFYYFWYFSPNQGSAYPVLWMKLCRFLYLLILLPAMFAMVYAVVLKKDKLSDIALIGLFFLAFTSAHALYYVEARHRWALEPILLIFTANAVVICKNFIHLRLPMKNRGL